MQRKALVSGAAGGIGRAIADRLEREGRRILGVDLQPDPDGPGELFEADLSTREVLLAPQAVKRMLEPEEVAETAAFQLGPAGRAFTGAPVVLDLGRTAR